jgi:hypothetical protein
MKTDLQRPIPDAYFTWGGEADDILASMWSDHFEKSVPEHACSYITGECECDICDAHTHNCDECNRLLDAMVGIDCMSGFPPDWADKIEQHRLVRIAREMVETGAARG